MVDKIILELPADTVGGDIVVSTETRERAEQAAAASEAARDQAQVYAANTVELQDTTFTALIADPESATRTQLNATFDAKIPGPAISFKELPGLLDNRYFNNSMSQGEPIVTVGTSQYVVWSNSERKPFVAKRTLPDGLWTAYDLTGGPAPINMTTALDEHNSYSIAVDSDGFIHVAGNMHGNPLRYARSTNAADITAWSAAGMIGTPTVPDATTENQVSYPKFFQHPDGTLFFVYRNGGSGSADWYLNQYNATTKTWSRIGKLFEGVANNESAYVDNVVISKNGVIHVSYQWRPLGGATVDTNDLSYVRSADKGVTWTTAAGVSLPLPITHVSSPVVHPTIGLQNSCGLAVDADGNPHIVNQKSEGFVNYQVRHYYWTGSAWVAEIVTKWTTTGVSWTPRPRIICTASGRTYVIVTYRWEGWAGKVWMIDVTPGSAKYRFPIANVDLRDAEVTFDARALRDQNVLHLLLTPASATPGFTADYWADGQWSQQWGGVLSIDLDQIEKVANGGAPRLQWRTISTIGVPQPTSIAATGTAVLLPSVPLMNTVPEMFGKVVGVRWTMQGVVTNADTTATLTIRELENGSGGAGRFIEAGQLNTTDANPASANQATPWLPLRHGPRNNKNSQVALHGVKVGTGNGTLYVGTLQLGVLDIN
jgi:hypothetical protein